MTMIKVGQSNALSLQALSLQTSGRLAAIGLVLVGLIPAFAAEGDSFKRKQQAQEKARALAGELVSGVLDIQIRQLEENGLKSLPIYKDILSMKGNIHELMKADMEEIVVLLVKAQEGTQKERLENFNKARARIREVVVQLMAERQKLFRRMQIAKLSAQVRELINMQTKTQTQGRSHNEATRDLQARAGDLIAESLQPQRYSLAPLLDEVSAENLHAEVDFGPAEGGEVW